MSEAAEVPASLQTTAAGDLDPFAATRHEDDVQAPARAGGQLACGAQVGRYVVMSKLGQGGMGVVYVAYDPGLDRKVALKLITGEAAAQAEDRLQREARAMAQLAHPNVVTVHDVGTLGGRLWIAMEFVDGVTLADWIRERRRGWREILGMFLAAGEGLVAAHRAGIVHRDFKPDNVMIGADGRARVMDFGIARAGASVDAASDDQAASTGGLATMTRVGAVMGTPRYMAPEQWASGTIDARTDEFAFCMALWEALFGQPPMVGQTLAAQALAVTTGHFTPVPAGARVPGWVRRACRRGLAVEPTQRWATMAELLQALRSDPAPRRRALAGVAMIAAVIGGVWASSELQAARREAACVAATAGLDAIWNPTRRAEVEAAMLASGVVHADTSFARAMPWLDLFVQRWGETAGGTCSAATIERTLAPERAWQIAACLDEGRAELGALIDALAGGEVKVVRPAASNAAQLSDPRACSDTTRVADRSGGDLSERAAVAELRRGLARTGVLRRSGQLGIAAATVAAIELRAKAMEAPIVLVMAQLATGLIAQARGDYVDARARMETAFYGAGAAAADELAVEAAQWLCFLVGYELGETEVGLTWGRIAEMTLARMQVGAVDLRRASLDADIGVVLLRHGNVEAALLRMHAAMATYEQMLGPEHPEVTAVLNNLGSAYYDRGAYDTSLATFERLLAIETRTLGPESSNVALTRGNIAAIHQALGRIEEARAGFTEVARILERNRGPDHPDVAAALLNLSEVEAGVGAVDQALVYARRALVIREHVLGPHSDHVAIALDAVGDLEESLGQLPTALAAHRRALAIYERNHGPKHAVLTPALRGIGEVLLQQGEVDAAGAYYVRALALDETKPPPAAARSLVGLGDVALARHEYAAARELYARAGALEEGHYGSEHPNITRTLIGRGQAELGLREATRAAALFERALRLHAQTPSSPVDGALARFGLGRALWAAGSDRLRALAEARTARDELRATGKRGRTVLAEVDAWLASKER